MIEKIMQRISVSIYRYTTNYIIIKKKVLISLKIYHVIGHANFSNLLLYHERVYRDFKDSLIFQTVVFVAECFTLCTHVPRKLGQYVANILIKV